ncbi:hypothetical protein [Lentilactobacillus buchneri]|uniref:Uncharacterized protein n=2 Tax=Lentilactobacillus buchneri TaxID=1581 RepID=J9W1Q9_LENBU|nr:hypothetical protein [Lentilactobacillus buchneri]MCC6100209.1 hypothetical protein [Lactobacillus sp.]AEB73414.1 hypothetical protein Lbuc_1156 [Lentilactobacillus buchneri NRRL B-30929]AFS00329.1 hypothetical protein LBUCD034_1291 [Lentilactobacillus buchneri subsp. silagei CD034]KRK67701.1 hypothetical protein FC79_GL001399 [Lentilactobacillus buchneri DSM 20057]MCT2881740.1 hypothetical protein [Lentilactobacillus buchneri]
MSNENTETEKNVLTTTELLNHYTQSIQAGLDNGSKYVNAFTSLNQTQDLDELLTAAVSLTNYQLNSDFVEFPHQFSDEDVQLVFFERLLKLSDHADGLSISNSEHVQKLLAKFSSLGDNTFTFTKSTKNAAGFFFGPTAHNRPLFYLNLKSKEMMFHGSALIDYFVVDLEGLDVSALKDAMNVIMRAAEVLKESFGFKIDFNVLDGVNGEFYEFAAGAIPEPILDELFVKSADNQYILMSGENGGASLTLDNDTQLNVYNAGDEDRPKWGATIHDQDQKESWLNLLLDYPFIKDWYLDNKKQLEILSNKFIFG